MIKIGKIQWTWLLIGIFIGWFIVLANSIIFSDQVKAELQIIKHDDFIAKYGGDIDIFYCSNTTELADCDLKTAELFGLYSSSSRGYYFVRFLENNDRNRVYGNRPMFRTPPVF